MMSCSLKSSAIYVSGSSEAIFKPKAFQKLPTNLQFHDNNKYKEFADQSNLSVWNNSKSPANFSAQAQATYCVSKAMRWWEKTLKPNMVEIHSAQELVDALKAADDRLVIVDFYSPGCGGCKSLHPKICQLAESNPDAIFLQVNYEDLKPMCHALHIHVLPFFRFYRGAEGKVCSFSCTISTIKKFKDALAKHGSERCSIGPAKGLDESELLKLAAAGELKLPSPVSTSFNEERLEELVLDGYESSNPLSIINRNLEVKEENNVLVA